MTGWVRLGMEGRLAGLDRTLGHIASLAGTGIMLAWLWAGRAGADPCADCHADRSLFTDLGARADSLVVTDASLASSTHAGLACADCHADLAQVTDFPHAEKLAPANCGSCHEDVATQFATSWHGQEAARRHGDVFAPTCGSCHGTHDIRPVGDTMSTVHPKNLPHTCAVCHSRLAKGAGTEVHLIDAYGRYVGGIHAERINAGVLGAATCNNCHGTHDLKRADDPASKVNKFNIPATCGQCHSEILGQYERGIHGQALAARVMDSPNCTDCHGEHQILAPSGASSPVNAGNLSDYVCAKCHNDPDMVGKYGLKGGRISSYQDSYHGMAVKRGSTKAANCVSCHKAHDILPATNPASSIGQGRIVATCQKCHPDANAEFAASYTHEAVIGKPDGIKRIIEAIYIPMIVILIGGMAIHNGIITLHYVRRKRALEKSQVTYERFSRSMVFQHAALVISFITLVITGFALRFPDAWWSQPLAFIGLTEHVRSLVHRIAAVVMMAASVYHVLFLTVTRRGRTELYHIIPRLSDVSQAWQNIRFHLGWTKVRPDFDRYEYTEKAEYWALVWGTIVMIVTGLVLWFPEVFTQHLKGWVVIASETIHYYEAWLATLAIVVWHFFFVIFHPDEFPMSLTWVDGKMTEHTLKEKHPAWYRRIAGQSQEPEDTSPKSRVVDKDKG